MNVADTCRKHGDVQISDHLALIGISAFAHTNNAIFLAANGTDLCFKRHALFCADLYQFLRLCNVLGNGIVRTVEHNGRKSCFDALIAALVATVVKMQCYGNRDLELLDHCLYHIGNRLKAAHILARAFGNTENYGRVQFLRGLQNCLRPLQIVNVELTDRIVACFCFFKHFFC